MGKLQKKIDTQKNGGGVFLKISKKIPKLLTEVLVDPRAKIQALRKLQKYLIEPYLFCAHRRSANLPMAVHD